VLIVRRARRRYEQDDAAGATAQIASKPAFENAMALDIRTWASRQTPCSHI